jgi:hypothetical protein
LANFKAKVQFLARPLMRSDNLAIAGKALELAQKADKVASRGPKRIRRLRRQLGVNQEGSETIFLEKWISCRKNGLDWVRQETRDQSLQGPI